MKEAAKRELTPLELWDQLAVQQVKHQLAPHGFKKIHNGKHEVTTAQFLSKQTVNMVCVISANLIRLYRENLRERFEFGIAQANKQKANSEEKLAACKFLQFRRKREFREAIAKSVMEIETLNDCLFEIDKLKPSTPKSKAEKTMEKIKESAKGSQ